MRIFLAVSLILFTATATAPALACNVPVFRYALERWRADRYNLTVLHRGPLTASQKALVAALEKSADGGKCNLTVAAVDLSMASAERQAELFKLYNIPRLPWVIVRYPDGTPPVDGPAFSGPLEESSLRHMLDSPVRTELTRRLMRGQSAVWLLLESGNAKNDDAVEANLKTWLGKLEKSLKLPERTSAAKDKLLRVDMPLKIEFSILRVSRAAAAEKHLAHLLLHMEKDLSHRTEPMVVPVFGRGMALYAIVGKGITEDNVAEAAVFLSGACSCEVKKQNPGVDLLMSADWEAPYTPGQLRLKTPEKPVIKLVPVQFPRPKASKDAPSSTPAPNETPANPQVEPAATPPSSSPGIGSVALLTSLGVVLLAALALGFYSFRKPPPSRGVR